MSRTTQAEALRSFYAIFKVLFPLAASFLFVPLLLREQQLRTLRIISVTQRSLSLLFFIRLVILLMFVIGTALIVTLIIRTSPPAPDWLAPLHSQEPRLHGWPETRWGGPDGVTAILLTLLAPTLLLAGVGTALGHVSADVRVGYLAIFALWMLNRAAGTSLDMHPLLYHLYLFVRSSGSSPWLIPKIVQLAGGLLLLLTATLLLRKTERLLHAPQ